METRDNHHIIMYRPLANAGRVKFFIPYPLKEKREAFKKLNNTFYHSNQKLWSISNTPTSITLAKGVFGDLLKIEDLKPTPKIPKVVVSEKIQLELDRNHQRMVLKGFSNSTIRSYEHSLGQFLSFFEKEDYRKITDRKSVV